MQTRAKASIATACALVLVACSSSGVTPGSEESAGERSAELASVQGEHSPDSAAPPAECTDAGSLADASADAGYFACAADSDCVAVRELFECCNNGWKIAVAKDEAAAYVAATACTARFCPEYMVDDTRVPACDMTARSCVMVEPRQTPPTPSTP